MNILERDNQGTHLVPLESRLFGERKLFLNESINEESAKEMIQALLYLEQADPEKPVRMYIHSPGGEVYAGMAIYDMMKALRCPVETYCTGMAASMAAIILAGGEPGRRFILPHSGVMIHEPLNMSGGGSATSIQRQAETILHLKDMLVEILAADCGRNKQTVEQAIAYDHFMSAQEAVSFGICDAVADHASL